MGTSALIAVKTESGSVGRLLNQDGYPENVLPHLMKIVARDGATVASATILGARYWRTLDGDQQPGPGAEDFYVEIEGYGEAYLDDADLLVRWEDAVPDVFVEYGYLIDPESGEVQATCFHGGREQHLNIDDYLAES